MLSEVADRLASVVFPRHCPCCDELTVDNAPICETCREELEKMRLGDGVCDKCGLPCEQCICGKRVFVFKGIAAPFRYEGAAAAGVVGIKRHKSWESAEFFSREVAKRVEDRFPGSRFDAVCSVPMHIKEQRLKGFDHAAVLAGYIAKELGIGYEELLRQTILRESQHKLSFEMRRENVKGIYSLAKNADVRGKRLLLVDDIKTSGATLNECAHILLVGGASSVICAAAAVTCKKHLVNPDNIQYNGSNGSYR